MSSNGLKAFVQLIVKRFLPTDQYDLISCQDQTGATLFRVGYDGMLGMVPRPGDGAIEWQVVSGGSTTTPLRVYNPGGGGFHFVSTPQSFAIPGTGYTNGIAISPMQIRGRKSTTGAPSSGTWTTGDVIMDSAKIWWLCTAGGTPGTWV